MASIEETTLIPKEDSKLLQNADTWTRNDLICVGFVALIFFGDGVEIYLPGVITQAVSCELGVTEVQEGILGVAMYLPLACSCIAGGHLSNRFGRRALIFSSLFTMIAFTIFCAVVPNYYTLILSRALIGFSLGLNSSTVGVFLTETLSSPRLARVGIFISVLLFALGGAWVALLGYLVLESLGWRVFLVCACLPLCILPVPILFCIKPSPPPDTSPEKETTAFVPETVSNVQTRILKATLCSFISRFQGYGTILLVPALIRQINEQKSDGDCQSTGVHGAQFLVLVAMGFANVVGRVVSFGLLRIASFRVLQTIVSILIALCYGVVIWKHDMVTVIIAMTTGKLLYAVAMNAVDLQLKYDQSFFGSSKFAVGSGIVDGVGYIGAVAGLAFAAFLSPHTVLIFTFVVSLFQVGVVMSLTELDSSN